MAKNTECFNGIIGLSTLECECPDLQAPTNAQISESGLYIDSLLNDYIFKLSQKGIDCNDNSNIWVQLERARSQAINKVISNISACIVGNYTENKKALLCDGASCTVKVGANKSSSFLRTIKENYVVVKVKVAAVGGGVFSLHKVGLYPFQKKIGNNYVVTPLTKDVFVFNENAEFLGGATIDTAKVGPRFYEFTNGNGNAEPLQICLSENECQYLYIAYEIAPDERPTNNDTGCGCGSSKAWLKKNLLSVALLQASDLDENFFLVANGKNCGVEYQKMASITFEASIQCDYDAMICDMVKNKKSASYKLIAELIQYESAIILIDRLRMSSSQKFGVSTAELVAIRQNLTPRHNELNLAVCSAFDASCYNCLKQKSLVSSRMVSSVKR